MCLILHLQTLKQCIMGSLNQIEKLYLSCTVMVQLAVRVNSFISITNIIFIIDFTYWHLIFSPFISTFSYCPGRLLYLGRRRLPVPWFRLSYQLPNGTAQKTIFVIYWLSIYYWLHVWQTVITVCISHHQF